jgi:two-component system response regulator PilR (NtrC family)
MTAHERTYSPSVLVVEDEPFSRQFLEMILKDVGCKYVGASSVGEGRGCLEASTPDLAILDIQLPDGTGLEIFEWLREHDPSVPVIIITAYGSISQAVNAMKAGAYDFITKPFEDTNKIRHSLKIALEHGFLRKENLLLRARLQSPHVFQSIIGKSDPMENIFFMIQKAAKGRSNVLIEGRSGTGKELVAKAIHDLSDRKDQAFIPVNCGALPENLLEAALFGHEKGSFTGAEKTVKGFFEEAHGGTLFLDEIGDAPTAVQVKILRAIEYGKIYRVGSTKPISVDVRFLFATHKDLRAEVETGRFREDLFFRINVINLFLPSLEERKEDIPMLVKHFLDKMCQDAGVEKKTFTDDAIGFFVNRAWPGNVRELRNFIERIVALHSGKQVSLENLTAYGSNNSLTASEKLFECDYENAKNSFEKKYFEKLIARCGGDLHQAVEQSGVHRATIYRKLKELNIKIN